MSHVKGVRRTDGYLEIDDKIRFKKKVEFQQGHGFLFPDQNLYFVDAQDGSDNYAGTDPTNAFATIQTAVTAASAEDTIYIRPQTFDYDKGFNRYTEDVTVSSGISSGTFGNANMSLIGVTKGGTGDFVGVRWKHATATHLTNYAPALHVENIGFFAEGATYAVYMENDGVTLTKQGSQGTSFYNCHFKGKGIYNIGGGDGLLIDTCRFQCSSAGVVAELNYSGQANPGRRLTVRNCEWLDGNATKPSGACITLTAPVTEFLIRDCFFPQLPTGNIYIATAGANYGLIANCYFNEADLDTDAEITLGTGVKVVGCYDHAGIATAA